MMLLMCNHVPSRVGVSMQHLGASTTNEALEFTECATIVVINAGARATLLLARMVEHDGEVVVCHDVLWVQWDEPPSRPFWMRASQSNLRTWRAGEVRLRRDLTGVLIAQEDGRHATFPQRVPRSCSISDIETNRTAKLDRLRRVPIAGTSDYSWWEHQVDRVSYAIDVATARRLLNTHCASFVL